MKYTIKKHGHFFKAFDDTNPKVSFGQISLKTGEFSGATFCMVELTEHYNKWKKENTYTPQLINVIEMINGVVSQVHSYLVTSKEEESIQSRNAETLFLQLVNENTKPIEPLTEDDVDFDSFDDQNGYEIITNWGVLHSLN